MEWLERRSCYLEVPSLNPPDFRAFFSSSMAEWTLSGHSRELHLCCFAFSNYFCFVARGEADLNEDKNCSNETEYSWTVELEKKSHLKTFVYFSTDMKMAPRFNISEAHISKGWMI